ncbi:mitochondrial import inner membrane translocase subunit tim23-1 [Phtheirospermum japonicum]|uniref:Mitochondrial import inner membrane translocase subunit tim23-1 n=1 Tax=Phtheirospermum japonicum TaxID=374723 RepID=A0A830CIH1_9LAMI|nr:mitochondrial import inner membrane translocase subunit tim23-1 [Phtheirospermum japonicum]
MEYQHRALDQAVINKNTSNRRLYNPYQDLNIPTRIVYNLPTLPGYLFAEESRTHRRSWRENLTYYTGIGYLTGVTAGTVGGSASSVKAIEPTDTLRLKINRILIGSGHPGRQVEKWCGIIVLMYAGLERGMVVARDTDDIINSGVAGLGTRALYKVAAGLRSAAMDKD